MLRTMRSNLKTLSWTLWLVILAFVGFIFVEWGMGTNAVGSDNTNYLMSIDGETISLQDFKYYQSLFKWNNNQIIYTLKQNGVLSHEAKKLNMIVSDQELNAQIFDIFQYKGVFIGMEQYRNFLARNKINIKNFETFLKRFFILPQKYRNLISSGEVIDEDSLKEKYHKTKDFADIEYIKISPEWIKDEIKITDKDREDYYKKHKNNYFSKEKRKGLVIFIKPESLHKGNLITDKEIENYYNNNLAQFQKKEKIRVSRIFLNYTRSNKKDIVRLANNIKQNLTVNNFSEKAKSFSQDEKSSNGGDWGYDLDKLIRKEKKIARSLEVNQISDLIYTGKSISILLVTEKSDEKTKPLETVKNIIRDRLTPQKMKEKAKKILSKIRVNFKNNKKIEDSKSNELIFKETKFIEKDQVVLGLDESSTLSDTLFKLKKNSISDIVEIIQNTKVVYGIVKCIDIKKAGIEKIENIKEKLDKDITFEKKAKLLKIKTPELSRALNSLKNKEDIKKYLKEQKLISDTFKYKRGNKLLNFPEKQGLDEIIFTLKEGMFSSPIIYKNTAVIVKLKSKNITTEEDYKRERTDFYNDSLRYQTALNWQSFINSKFDSYQKAGKIRVNAELVNGLLKQKNK